LAGAGNVRIGDEKLMTDSLKEQLSACLDGELRDGELELLLKRFERDPELQETLGRYALISQALQGQRPVAASTQFASKVQAAIDGEPVSPHRVHKRTGDTVRWLRPVAGFAVAAGVATVAILSLQRPGGAPEQPLVAANPPTVTTVDEPSYIVPNSRGLHQQPHSRDPVDQLCRRAQRVFLTARASHRAERRAGGR
jgi:sigma-E factor negative regulatory protein RseA